MKKILILLFISGLFFLSCANKRKLTDTSGTTDKPTESARRAEVLFLGNEGRHHDSGKYAPWLAIELFKSGINLTYTTDLNDLNEENLAKYDGLIIYANHDSIAPSQEAALKNFVENGKGLIPLHSASGCFHNSEWYIKAIGGQFASHGNGSFTSHTLKPSHPVMKGVAEFTTTDETYVHKKLNPDIEVLMEREEDGKKEPYTWVRNEGKGRVFYTAYGHDDATWKNHNFLKMVSNGVLWAIGDEVKTKIANLKIPNVSIYPDSIANFNARHLVPKIQEGLSPEESMKLIQVPADFEVKLFAAEPDITNPIAMAWDERGRLWIVESVDYPNTFVETDGAANDRIKICEDTDGDGKADKFTIFADSLNIPTSIVFSNGGIIVSQAPNMVFLKDTDGDDKADIHQILSTGWGKNDTHAGPSNLQYGFDNKIWGVVGFSGFKGKMNGKDIKFGQGVYRFQPDGKDFEYLATTSNNTWGLGFSEDNNVFISTANNTHSAFYSMPASYTKKTFPGSNLQSVQKIDGHYDVHTMTPNLRQVDVVGGFTSAAGHHLYTARNFPEEYWNRVAFVNEPTVKLIHQAIIEKDGAGFKEKDGWNLMASSDEWVGPVQAQVGPDGAVWVADWYNFVIQHNTFVPGQALTEYILPLTFADQKRGQGSALETKLRDLDRGRIYRVVYKKAKPYKPLSLAKDDVSGLVEAISSDNMFWRLTAQRLLVEKKDPTAIPGLLKLINDKYVDKIGLNGPAVNALWTLHGMGVLDGSNVAAMNAVTSALSHPAAGVRKAAVEVLPKNEHTVHLIQESGILNDNNLNTRMAAVLVLAELPPSAGIASIVYDASMKEENGKDKWLAQAWLITAINNKVEFLKLANDKNDKLSTASFSEQMLAMVKQDVDNAGKADKPEKVAAVTPKKSADAEVIKIKVVKDLMQFDKKLIAVKTGQRLVFEISNPDGMQHNMLIIKPGTLQKVGKAADDMLRDPKAAQKQYVPDMPEILHATKLLNTGDVVTFEFTVPNIAGDYPFLCTFPGHWRGMNGIIRVTK
ncbi:putative membrane-bound dehydrogenase-like protein [Pedobacter sp. UYP30]|uniref:PVC-type heme-binding CxxCH protein n=1 Tax=Pedobacter sp. UYP30 TaxID=1756400 RepID=UPI003395BAA6